MSDKDSKEDLRSIPADQRSQGPNETMILNSSDLASKVTASAAGSPKPIQGTPKLVGRGDAVAGKAYELNKPKTMVGRQDNNDIIIEDETVSARHAQIVNDGGTWRVVNLISTNGTSVNGRTNIVSYLAPGDVISFGRVEMVFEAAESERTLPNAVGRGKRSSTQGDSSKALLWTLVGVGVVLVTAAAVMVLGWV